MRCRNSIITIAPLVLILALLAGCNEKELATLRNNLATTQDNVDRAEKLLQQYQEHSETLAQIIKTLPIGDANREKAIAVKAKVDAYIPQVQGYISKASSAIDDFQQQIEGWKEAGPVELVGSGVASVSTTLPQPWGAIGSLLGAFLVGVGTYWTGKKTGTKQTVHTIVPAIEAAKKGQVLDFSDKESVDMLRAILGPEINKLVDSARGK